MDYFGINCTVCNNEFKQGDDIVVCPECGTPHHRVCYEETGRCINADKHSEDFEFKATKETNEEKSENAENKDVIICQRCKNENPKGTFYCGKCGFPVGVQQNVNNSADNNQPFGMPVITIDAFDPMGGIDPETDMGDGVNAGEMSKYVQKSTAYFSRVFHRIKEFGKGKFSFSAFLFSGGYLLYRKMYKIGAVITAIMLLLMFAELYVYTTPAYQELSEILYETINSVQNASYSDNLSTMINTVSGLSAEMQYMMIFLYSSSIIQLIIQIVVGIKANKWYFNHCKKEIVKIKKNNENAKKDIETKGGVNVTIATSLLVVYVIISYAPMFL